MTIEEFKNKRTERLKALHEKLSNMPDDIDDKVHGEIDIVTLDAIESSKERDEKVKDSFKDKNKETREFIKDQDKATEAGKDEKEKAEDRLFLNESLFEEEYDSVREYSDMLFDMIEDGVVDARQIAEDLIYWCSEDDIKRYMEVNDIIATDESEEESLNESVTMTEAAGKKIEKVRLVSGNGIPEALSNVLFMGKCNEQEFKSDLMVATSPDQFKRIAEKDTGLPWSIFEENDTSITLLYKDRLGNKDYLKGIYAKGASESGLRVLRQILIGNGVAQDKVEGVIEDILTALGTRK